MVYIEDHLFIFTSFIYDVVLLPEEFYYTKKYNVSQTKHNSQLTSEGLIFTLTVSL